MQKLGFLFVVMIYLTSCAAPNTVKVNYDSAEISAEAALQRELALNKILRLQNSGLNTVSRTRSLRPLQSFCTAKRSYSMGARGSSSSDYKDAWRTTANKNFWW